MALNVLAYAILMCLGKRQDPDGAYAAVIPKWTAALLKNETVFVNGDGETSRDFCYIENTVQMNILAATASDEVKDQVYNVAVGDRTTLNTLFAAIRQALLSEGAEVNQLQPEYRDFRAGDVRHSQADIAKAQRLLGYAPQYRIEQGIAEAMGWYVKFCKKKCTDSMLTVCFTRSLAELALKCRP